jgi:hypothetical protein
MLGDSRNVLHRLHPALAHLHLLRSSSPCKRPAKSS